MRQLFPPADATLLSGVRNYLYQFNGDRLVVEYLSATYRVYADGAGNWVLRMRRTSLGAASGKWAGGFVFAYSDDSNGHGYVITSDFASNLAGIDTLFQAFGSDPWIKDRWPRLFGQSCYRYISEATGSELTLQLPPISDAATDHGFSGLTVLEGAQESKGDFWSDVPMPSHWPKLPDGP
jgi:hypothetical protein